MREEGGGVLSRQKKVSKETVYIESYCVIFLVNKNYIHEKNITHK